MGRCTSQPTSSALQPTMGGCSPALSPHLHQLLHGMVTCLGRGCRVVGSDKGSQQARHCLCEAGAGKEVVWLRGCKGSGLFVIM